MVFFLPESNTLLWLGNIALPSFCLTHAYYKGPIYTAIYIRHNGRSNIFPSADKSKRWPTEQGRTERDTVVRWSFSFPPCHIDATIFPLSEMVILIPGSKRRKSLNLLSMHSQRSRAVPLSLLDSGGVSGHGFNCQRLSDQFAVWQPAELDCIENTW